MLESDAKPWRIRLFGALEITAPSGQCLGIESRKSAELLSYLALRRSATADRDTVSDALWPDCDPLTARNRLRQTLSGLRKEIGDLPLLAHGKNILELPPDRIEIDFHVIERRLKWLRALGGWRRQDAARQILETIRPGLLPGFSTPWVEADRRRYESVARELDRELKDADASSSPTFQLGDDLGGLIVPIVGRESELSQVREWLKSADERRLYLVGPPGVGKTRVLVEILATCGEPIDAILSLSTVQATEVPWQERLAAAMGMREPERISIELIQLLGDFKSPVVAIDDIDQADRTMSEWIEQILASVPRLRLVATARQWPSASQGTSLHINPLPLLRDGDLVAANLLVRFAANAGVSPGELQAHRGTMEELAEHLEGLPLALEVAAGWLPFLAPENLLRKLKEGPEMVVGRAAKGRGSLVQCIEAIRLNLSEQERQALLCLSICEGGCGEALADEMLGSQWPWHIRSLSERSLALRVKGSAGVRFLVLQAIRDSVRSLSSPEQIAESIRRHTEACFRLGSAAVLGVREGDRKAWLDWLRDEGNNVIAACARSLDDRSAAVRALRLLLDSKPAFWLIARPSGHKRLYDEAKAKWDPIFNPIDGQTPAAIIERRIDILTQAGKLADAVELTTEFRRKREELGDIELIAEALDYECDTRRRFGDMEGALQCSIRSGELDTKAGNLHKALWIKSKTSGILRDSGRTAEFLEFRRRSFTEAIEIGDRNSEGMYAKEFAKSAMREGDWAEARQMAERSVTAFRLAGETMTHFDALLILTAALIGAGEKQAASQSLEEAERYSAIADERRLSNIAFLHRALVARSKQITTEDLIDIDRYD